MRAMNCWKCNKALGVEKIAFRAACPHCGSDLHTCTGCRYYAIGKPNDCLVPGTESIRDRETANFCEEFKHKSAPPKEQFDAKSKFNSLFNDN